MSGTCVSLQASFCGVAVNCGASVTEGAQDFFHSFAAQKRCVELDGGVLRVTGLLDTLVAADMLQRAAAADRARALSQGAALLQPRRLVFQPHLSSSSRHSAVAVEGSYLIM